MRVSLRALMALAVWAGVTTAQGFNSTCDDVEGSIYDYSLLDQEGNTLNLDEYQGKVLIIFNCATYWGFTYQYGNWNAIKASINNTNFELLAIPTNQFGLQEPGSDEEIPNQLRYVRPGNDFIPNYRFAAKTEVNGDAEEPLYSFLKGACPGPQLIMGSTERYYFTPIKQHDITWNFEKFLISAEGKPVGRYNPATSPFDIVTDIEDQLALVPIAEEKEVKETKEVEIKDQGNEVGKKRLLQGMAQAHMGKPNP